MSLRVAVAGEVKDFRSGAEAKASLNRAFSQPRQTRNLVIYNVEKFLDELRVGVKGQSN